MFKPIGSRIVVRVENVEERKETASGLILPDAVSKEKPQEGEVVAIGSIKQDIKVGDKVLYGKFSGTEVKLDGLPFLILMEDDVLGVL